MDQSLPLLSVRHIPDSRARRPNARTRLRQAKVKIAEGREQKTNREAYTTFKDSFDITCELSDAVHPVRVVLGLLLTFAPIIAATVALTKYLWP